MVQREKKIVSNESLEILNSIQVLTAKICALAKSMKLICDAITHCEQQMKMMIQQMNDLRKEGNATAEYVDKLRCEIEKKNKK